MSGVSHQGLSDEQLTLFLEDRLDAADRHAAEDHLSRCDGCRRRLVEAHHHGLRPEPFAAGTLGAEAFELPVDIQQRARALARQQLATGRRRWLPWVLGTAASAVAALLILLVGRPPQSVPAPTLQSGGTAVLRSEDVASPWGKVSPADGSRQTGPEVELGWSLEAPTRRLILTVLDDLGNIRWRSEVKGDRQPLTAEDLSPSLRPGATVYWYLTAQLDDGSTVESEIASFIWMP